jgi:DNA circularisation protein N-terminus
MARDLYALLPNVSWRGIPFPVESLENDLSQMHVEHYFVYKDGCHIEATGRNALVFQARIPFHNGIIPGPGESWNGQILYPDLFRKFLAACIDRTSGELRHPDFGAVQCKARNVKWRYAGGMGRDGATIDVSWHETTDNGDNLAKATSEASPIAAAIAAADAIDANLAVKRESKAPADKTFMQSLGDSLGKRFSFGDSTRAYNDGTGSLGDIKRNNDNLASGLDAKNDVNDWRLRQSSEDLRAATFSLSANPNTDATQSIQGHTTENPTTVPLLAVKLNTSTQSLISLNPSLATQSRVPSGTKVLFSTSI